MDIIIVYVFAMCAVAFMAGVTAAALAFTRYVRKVIIQNTVDQIDGDEYNEHHVNGRLEVTDELLEFFTRK